MALTYATYAAKLSNMIDLPEADSNFIAMLPQAIEYAENRIYRELNLLSTVVRDSTANCATAVRDFTLPVSLGRFVTVIGINVLTPVGTTAADGTRNSLQPTSREYIDYCWPENTSQTAATPPSYYAMITDQTLIFGPAPGAAFNVEVVGTIRPEPLSAANTTTVLGSYLPDLFMAASMVFMIGYQRNFGAQADDPKMAVSWESQYQTLLASANAEEMRKRYAAGG